MKYVTILLMAVLLLQGCAAMDRAAKAFVSPAPFPTTHPSQADLDAATAGAVREVVNTVVPGGQYLTMAIGFAALYYLNRREHRSTREEVKAVSKGAE